MIVLKPFNGRTRRFAVDQKVTEADAADMPFSFAHARSCGFIGEPAAAAVDPAAKPNVRADGYASAPAAVDPAAAPAADTTDAPRPAKRR